MSSFGGGGEGGVGEGGGRGEKVVVVWVGEGLARVEGG